MRKHRKWLVLAFPVALVVVMLSTDTRRTLKTRQPFMGLYLRYSKWRYNWRSPSDMGYGKNALQIVIEGPMGIAEDKNGNIYVSDRDARFVWKIAASGQTTVVAGTGMSTGPNGLPLERTPARDVDFASPEGLVIDHDGNILLADSLNHEILKIDSAGYMTRVAGNGKRGYDGDGKAATASSLASPYDVRIDSKGNVYIADVFNHRIRMVDRKGIMSTIAGTGVAGYSGDGGPAVNAQLNTPYGVFLDHNDNLLIADSENHVIRSVGRDGVIHTIAGSGKRGYDGDGGPVLEAKFDTPQSLGIDAEGRIYIGDEHNNAIRVLDLDGTVRTLVGSRGPGFSGDGGAVPLAQVADPENVWVRKDGSLLISARDNSRVRIVSPDGKINTFAGRGPTSKHDYYAPIRLPAVDP